MKKKIFIFLTIFFIGMNFTYAKEIVEFSDCVDGDTIKVVLDNKKYTVRMLAVDTPESVHPTKGVEYYGKEASEYTCNKVKNAKKLEVEYDPDSDKTDKYDRLLVWVFTDGELLQKDLVANGYAKVAYLYGDYKYTSELESVQEKASAKSLGIWNEEAKSVAIFSGKRIVSMVVGERTMYINGTPVAMNTAPEICSERTFIPIRDFANAMGIKDIVFDEEKYMVLLN